MVNQGQASALSGVGTPRDPYILETCADLQDINDNLTGYYMLGNDIDCLGATISPIGTSGTPFSGSLYGAEHEISNFVVTGGSYTGLFAAMSEGVISDLYLSNITVNPSSGAEFVGGLVGSANMSFISRVRASDITINVTGGQHVGGVVGYLGGSSVEISSAEDVLITTSSNKVGGLVGTMIGPTSVSDSFASGSISGSNNVGGLVGIIDSGPTVLSDSYAEVAYASAGSGGAVVGSGSASFGGGVYASSSLTLGANVAGWDFDGTWQTRTNDYPSHIPTVLPTVVCGDSTVDDTSFSWSCSLTGDPTAGASWLVEYRKVGASSWTDFGDQTGDSFAITIPGLESETDYEIRIRFASNAGANQWSITEFTTLAAGESAQPTELADTGMSALLTFATGFLIVSIVALVARFSSVTIDA